MIALSLPCDGMDSSRRWFESHQSFCLFVYIVKLSFRTAFLAVRLWDCKYIYCKVTYLSSVLRRYPKSWVAVEKCICLKNTSLIGQISFNGQRCDLQIHDCFLNDRQSRVRDRFISYSKYSRRGTLFIQKKVGSALTETENWDLLVDCTSRDGRQMLDAGVHLSDKRTLL
jgi:hypothetical protein